MRTTLIRILTILMATITAITFLFLAELYPKSAKLILSIEILLLPTIYIIGYEIVEAVTKKEHEEKIEKDHQDFDELNETIKELNILFIEEREKRKRIEMERDNFKNQSSLLIKRKRDRK